MTDLPADFDLKLMPDWLKDSATRNPYANFSPDSAATPRHGMNRHSRRDHKDSRSERPARRPQADRKGKPSPRNKRGEHPRPKQAAEEPLPNLGTEFFPEPHFVASLGKQIKSSARAFPLLELARMFMDKPERHRIRISSKAANTQLFQCGEDASLDRALLENSAFAKLKGDYYSEEVSEREPLKGNFNSVARCRLTGVLLGPTNYHAYQPSLHKLYEERFSRRMSFQEFTRQIEIISDPAAVESWKEQARKVVTYKTLKETEQLSFNSAAEAEQHFRKTYLPSLIKVSNSVELSGTASRTLGDRRLIAVVRAAWEKQRGFPGQIMHHLRQRLQHSGLHWFRPEGPAQYLTGIRPTPFNKETEGVSEAIKAIFKAVESTKPCTRADLATALLPADSQELEKLKAGLAADLHWLIQTGHVVEFADGKLILAPVPEKTTTEQKSAEKRPTAETVTPSPAIGSTDEIASQVPKEITAAETVDCAPSSPPAEAS